MDKEDIRYLIKVAKTLKSKKDKNQITEFERAELKEIYKILLANGEKDGV